MKKIKLFGVFLIILAILVLQLPMPEADAATSVSDFSISGTTLTKYLGKSSVVVIPDTVETIATDAFKDNKTVTKITLGKNVKEIEPYSFWNCEGLQEVYLNSVIEEIDDYAFANCKGLRSMTLPKNIKTIGIRSFQDCVNLTEITIPAETMFIHETAFDGCYNLVIHAIAGTYAYEYAKDFAERQKEFPEYEDVPSYSTVTDTTGDNHTVTIVDVSGNTNEITAPSDSSTVGMTVSPDGTYRIDEYTIPASDSIAMGSVRVVANSAFVFLDNTSQNVYHGLKEPDNTEKDTTGDEQQSESISNNSGTGLPKYTIVDGKIVADEAYYNNGLSGIVSITQGIEEIGQFAYARNDMKEVIIPEGTKAIDYGAFYHCDNLSRVVIPSSVEIVEPMAFEHTEWVQSFLEEGSESEEPRFLISGGVLVAYTGAAMDVSIPDSVRVIAARAFEGHSEIETVTIPSSVESIGEDAFIGCSSLRNIKIYNDCALRIIRDRAFYDALPMKVTLPDSVKYLGLSVFADGSEISFEDRKPDTIFEASAQRLSNASYRKTEPSESESGISVVGLTDIALSLEGANDAYTLFISETKISNLLTKAMDRASDFEQMPKIGRQLCTYEFVLQDGSGIPITKLGKQSLTVAIPFELCGADPDKSIIVFTVDRNGQLETVPCETILTDGKQYVRFSVSHLSPFGIFESDDDLEDVVNETTVLGAMAPPLAENETLDTSFTMLFSAWFRSHFLLVLISMALLSTGVILLIKKS